MMMLFGLRGMARAVLAKNKKRKLQSDNSTGFWKTHRAVLLGWPRPVHGHHDKGSLSSAAGILQVPWLQRMLRCHLHTSPATAASVQLLLKDD